MPVGVMEPHGGQGLVGDVGLTRSDRALLEINGRLPECALCPRLIGYGREVAQTKRRAYADETYHGRPVPNFLPPTKPSEARLLIVGLAPGAHGAHRTGRMFTGDRSGDFLFEALHRTGWCNQPTCRAADDGLQLRDVIITAAVHCAPPGNKPTAEETSQCGRWLDELLELLRPEIVTLCLGRLALAATLAAWKRRGWTVEGPSGQFSHGLKLDPCPLEPAAGSSVRRKQKTTRPPGPIFCSYHPSQQNTFTGRLTMPMLTGVLEAARQACTAP